MKPKQIAQLKIEQKQLEEGGAARRAMAVLLLVGHGDIELSGYTKDHAKRLKAQYLRYGIEAFRDKRQSSHNRVLTKAEREAVIQTLRSKQPKDLIPGCSDGHWSTYWLGQYVLAFTGKRYKSKTSQYLLFHEAKLSFHLPGKLYEKSDPAAKAAWAKNTTAILETKHPHLPTFHNCLTICQVNQKQITELENLRRATKQAATANRALAILLLVKNADMGFSVYSVDHARRLKYAYLKDGIAALEDKRINNRERILTRTEREEVVTTLQTKQPKDVIFACEVQHWTTGLLGLYIFDQFGKRYKSKTSERLLFREAKLTWHCPGRVYEKADPEARTAWVEVTMPILKKLWNTGNTVVLCEDEMVLTSSTTIQKVWLPQGQYPPVTETNSTKKRKSFYGFLNLKTGQEYTFITDWQNMYITVEVLEKLRKVYPTQKLVLIWDNCGWHRGSKVTEWIEQDTNTETIYFPPYTPDFNPQEHVWKAGRKAVTHNQYIQKIEGDS